MNEQCFSFYNYQISTSGPKINNIELSVLKIKKQNDILAFIPIQTNKNTCHWLQIFLKNCP